MAKFITPDFLLSSSTAKHLYHDIAAKLPIIDYHCHLSPKMIADDHRFASITELWLGGDHYKWRAMRANGVDERFITGDASDFEKFEQWAATLPYAFRNPLYHWSHLELSTAFGIDEVLNPDSARWIFDRCNELLQQPEYSARGLMRRYGVEVVCTTDDPVDSLCYHCDIAASGFEIKVLPAWRPDKAMAVADADAYNAYVDRLAEVADVDINSYDALIEALNRRHAFFASMGCSVADHGVSSFPFADCTADEARRLWLKVRSGKLLNAEESTKLQTALLLDFARMNASRNWVQQFHFGPLRNTNSRRFAALGPDTGFDTIGDFSSAAALARFFDALDADGLLAKTILYNINPGENEMVAAMIANFQDGSVPGKMQMGSAWWFNDHLDGMRAQIDALSRQGLLSRFVGMLTDSRSFVSYTRHEYFRRLLCQILGADFDAGLIPQSELPRLEQMTADICHHNAARYFGF